MEQKKKNYELNISSLKKFHPNLLRTINDPAIEPFGELIEIANGEKNLKVSTADNVDFFLHGETGPVEDTAQFLEIAHPDISGVIVMMGFGLGIPSLELLKNRPKIRHLFIFESNLGIFKRAIQAYDLSELFSDSRVIFCTDKQPDLHSVFIEASKALELEDIQILRHSPSFKINTEYIKLSEQIFEYLNTFSIRGATTKTLGEKFTRNRIKNLKRFRHDVLVDSIQGIFNNTPAVLVAGGPSLDKNISQLKKLKGKAVIFAVDTVVPTLLKNDIIPEFISSIDPQDITLEKYQGVDLQKKGISLICSAWVTPRVPFHLPVDRVIWTFGARAIEQWFNNSIGGKTTYIGAGTVAHLNLNVAIDVGCSPIIFVGQDLAFSETRDHASNVALKNYNQMEDFLSSKSNWTWVDGFYGDKVKTSRSFLDNKKVFESIIKSKDSIEFINATEGGAHIEGTKPMALKEVIDTFAFRFIQPEKTISQNAEMLGREKVSELDKQLEELINTGNKILKLIKKTTVVGLEITKGINRLRKKSNSIKNFSSLPQSLQKKLNKIDSLNTNLDKQGLFWHLLDEVTFKGLRQSEKMLFDIDTKNKNKGGYLDWLQKNVERIEYINKVRKDVIVWLNRDVTDVLDFHKKEEALLINLNHEKTNAEKIRSLCKLYSDHGITALALKHLQTSEFIANDPELNFIKGCSESYYAGKSKAETYFQKALTLKSEIKSQVDEFMNRRSEEYFNFGKKWIHIDTETSRSMFIKSLWYNPEHSGTLMNLNEMLATEIEKTTALVNEKQYSKAKKINNSWVDAIEKEERLMSAIKKEKTADLYGLAGQIFIQEEDGSSAYKMYKKAIDLAPENPQYYIALTDLCFSMEDFDNGVKALNKAVELDRANAKYWELIGDHMMRAKNMNDALSAYEKCFMEMPENINLLLKMGEIYTILGQPLAAQEARLQYQKLKNSNSLNS